MTLAGFHTTLDTWPRRPTPQATHGVRPPCRATGRPIDPRRRPPRRRARRDSPGAGRLPRRVQPAPQGRRAARPCRLGDARDRGRRDPGDQARRRLGRTRPGAVRPRRHRRRRRPPLARLLADPRSPRRRLHLDHRQGRARRQGQQPHRPRLAAPARWSTSSRPPASSCCPPRVASSSSSPPDPASLRSSACCATCSPSPTPARCASTAARSFDITVVHVAPSEPHSIFIDNLRSLDEAGMINLVARYDDEHGVLDVNDLDELVPDLQERTTFACGPAGLLDALEAHHAEHGLKLLTEQFRVAPPGGRRGRHRQLPQERHHRSRRPATGRSSSRPRRPAY